MQAELAPMQDEDDVKRLREENGHTNGHFQVRDMEAASGPRKLYFAFLRDLPSLQIWGVSCIAQHRDADSNSV